VHRRRATVALVALTTLSACGGADATPSAASPMSQPPSSPSRTPAIPSAAPSASEGLAAAPDAQVLAAGVISTDAEEYRISFTPDGAAAYFARGDAFFPQSRQATIYEARFEGGEWTEPEVASFSGDHPDIDPWVSPDGTYLLFSSIRPVDGVDRSDAELFRVDREGDGWGEPVHLPSLGSDADELGASVAEDGLMIFASDRPGGAGGWDLYVAARAEGGWDEPSPLDALNTADWEFNPAIDPAGERLVFTSIGRAGGSGLGDLFVSEAEGGAWAEERPLPMNSAADEYHPSTSPDGRTLYFVRRSGDGDLYEVPWAELLDGT
jgi:Tol biopolymer transport system component